MVIKGQLISKGLFGILNSSKKRTKKFDLTTMIPQVEFSFICLEELKTLKGLFKINWPLISRYKIRTVRVNEWYINGKLCYCGCVPDQFCFDISHGSISLLNLTISLLNLKCKLELKLLKYQMIYLPTYLKEQVCGKKYEWIIHRAVVA